MVHELARPGRIKVQTARLVGCLTSDPVDPAKIGLYWSIFASCRAIDYLGNEWEPGLLFDGLVLRDLDKVSLSSVSQPQAECLFYIGMHDMATKWDLSIELDKDKSRVGRMTYDVVIDYSGMDGDDDPALRLSGSCALELGKIDVPRNMFFPKPANAQEAQNLLEPYFPMIKDWEPFIAEDADGWPVCNEHSFSFALKKQN